jgi:hypothetical protein
VNPKAQRPNMADQQTLAQTGVGQSFGDRTLIPMKWGPSASP